MDSELARILADAGPLLALILLGFPIVALVLFFLRSIVAPLIKALSSLVSSIAEFADKVDSYERVDQERDQEINSKLEVVASEVVGNRTLVTKILTLTDKGVGVFNSLGVLISSNEKFVELLGRNPTWLNMATYDTAKVLDITGMPLAYERWPVGVALATCKNCVAPVELYCPSTQNHKTYLAKAYPFFTEEGVCMVTLVLEDIGVS